MGYVQQEMRFLNGEIRKTAVKVRTKGDVVLCQLCETIPVVFACTYILRVKTEFVRGKERQVGILCGQGYCEYHVPAGFADRCASHVNAG